MDGKDEKIRGSIFSFIVFSSILLILIVISIRANGENPPVNKCLIIVSGSDGYSPEELSKSASFYEYIKNTCTDNDIYYLTDPSESGADGPATVSNVQAAFQWLISNSLPSDEIVIYISDHAKKVFDETYFAFDDGNISALTIDSWLDQIQCSSMTVILNGERSGLGGEDLADPSRDVICSMGSNQQMNPDLFNITRSLEDPTADLDSDGIVDYIEAFTKEVELLQGSGQDPVIYQGS